MVTITDIAERAKVSTSTVSRLLNEEKYVAPATALAIRAAMKELGYVPRLVRPGPKTTKRAGVRTGAISFLSASPVSPAEMYTMPVFPGLLAGVQRGAERGNMEVVLSHLPNPEVLPPTLAHHRVDGLVVFFTGPQRVNLLKDVFHHIPSVGCFLGDTRANHGLGRRSPVRCPARHPRPPIPAPGAQPRS